MVFELKENLPKITQDRLAELLAKASAKRTTEESAFLASLEPYQVNKVISYDTTHFDVPQEPKSATRSSDLILHAEGNTIPEGYEGFKKGALFRDLDASGGNLYVNVGDNTSASWVAMSEVGSRSPSVSVSASGSPSPSLSPSL